jgi:hypothetical protein
MSKFKVGDRVRFRDDYPSSAAGKDAVVINVHTSWGIQVRQAENGDVNTESPESLRLVAEATSATPAIVCLLENGQPLPNSRPFVHPNKDVATTEASRLAGKHPGKEFGVYELVGTKKEAKPTYKHAWQRLAADGRKIAAIVELRTITGFISLRSAKLAVEHFLEAA